MTIKFKKGDMVLATKNAFWGSGIMRVTETYAYSNTVSVSCKTSCGSLGAFDQSELVLVRSKQGQARLKQVKEYVKLHNKLDKFKERLFK